MYLYNLVCFSLRNYSLDVLECRFSIELVFNVYAAIFVLGASRHLSQCLVKRVNGSRRNHGQYELSITYRLIFIALCIPVAGVVFVSVIMTVCLLHFPLFLARLSQGVFITVISCSAVKLSAVYPGKSIENCCKE